jgi:hypothetical protein
VVRAVRTQASTLAHTFTLDEEPATATGDVVVTVVDANGDPVTSGNATADGDGYRYTLAGQPDLADLTVTWSATIAGTDVVETEIVSVVGRRLFTLAEGRSSDDALADPSRYTTEDLRAARDETEDELEEITDRAWVPRYGRAVLDGTGTSDLVLPHRDVTAVLAARMAGRLDETFEALTAGQLAALSVRPDGSLRRADGEAWTWGSDNVVVEYERLYAATLPADLRRAVLIRFRSRLNMPRSGIPDRATSFTSGDGGTYRLSMPGAYQTGIPEVDAAYWRYSARSDGPGKRKPASRTLSYEPQAGSLFHRRY